MTDFMEATRLASDRVLVTGAAGFIGYHVVCRLMSDGAHVVGVDNLNSYYDITLKRDRLAALHREGEFTFVQADVADVAAMTACFETTRPARVIHLAAQAGVRGLGGRLGRGGQRGLLAGGGPGA